MGLDILDFRKNRPKKHAGFAENSDAEPVRMLNFMKIGFISPPVPGHFNPMSAVARLLEEAFGLTKKVSE